jgi:hypothetical protein
MHTQTQIRPVSFIDDCWLQLYIVVASFLQTHTTTEQWYNWNMCLLLAWNQPSSILYTKCFKVLGKELVLYFISVVT